MYNIIMIALVGLGFVLLGAGVMLVLKKQTAKSQTVTDDFSDSFGEDDFTLVKEKAPKPKKKAKKKKKSKVEGFSDDFDEWGFGGTETEDERFTAIESTTKEPEPQEVFKNNSATNLFRTSDTKISGRQEAVLQEVPVPSATEEDGNDAVRLLRAAFEHISNQNFRALGEVVEADLLHTYEGRQRDYAVNGIHRVTSIVKQIRQEVVAVREEQGQIYVTVSADLEISDYIVDVKTKEVVGGSKVAITPVSYSLVTRQDKQTLDKFLQSVKLI